jgi:hypothetical protein
MLDFAGALPALRTQVADDLAVRGLPREWLLACAARLLDRGFFRIGSETYAEENGTFGPATLRRQHVRLQPDCSIVFSFVAKGRKRRIVRLRDDDVLAVLWALKRCRGATQLFAYRNGTGLISIRSNDRDRARRDRRLGAWPAGSLAIVAAAGRPPGKPRGVAVPRQHPRGLPRLLHRPSGVRVLLRRPDDRARPRRARRAVGSPKTTCVPPRPRSSR